MTEEIRPAEFLQEDITSENGRLIKILIRRLDEVYDDIPTPYVPFLNDLGKTSSVSGLLQCTGPEALQILMDFCNEQLDLRSNTNREKIETLKREFPALWSSLQEILLLEKTHRYLPPDTSAIVRRLLEIRVSIFENSLMRDDDRDYYW